MDFLTAHAESIWYGLEWAIRIGALAVVPQRRSPAAARAWLLLIFFFPLPGLILFLAIGQPRFPDWRIKRFEGLRSYFQTAEAQLAPYRPALGPADPIAALAMQMGHMPPTDGNQVELIDDYGMVIDRLIADIDAATQSVHLLVYIFADDAVGQRVARALGRAVARGVDARVLFDPVGSYRWRRGTEKLLRAQGVRMRETLPFRLLRGRTRRDMRNHRKLFVIDECIGYAGSQNIVTRDFRRGVVNRELVARVTGPVVASMSALVRGDWSMETGKPPAALAPIAPATGQARLQLLPSGPEYALKGFETLLVWQLHQAREQVIIVTPYFIPDEDVLAAMHAAVARGVRVALVISQTIDQPLVNLAQSTYYEDLLAGGVEIYRYPRFLLHAKNLSIDDTLAVVGSSNVDLRSFQLNEEASLLLYDAPSIADMLRIQMAYLDASERLTLSDWHRRPRLRRLLENIARLVSSLL